MPDTLLNEQREWAELELEQPTVEDGSNEDWNRENGY